jgi:hypothetical protein
MYHFSSGILKWTFSIHNSPCGFGQSLWPTNCLVNFSFFWSAKWKLSHLRDWTMFFVHSLEFFVQSFLKIGHSLISRLDKKSRDWTKENDCPVSKTGQFFLANQKKKKNWPDNWSAMRLTKTTWMSHIRDVHVVLVSLLAGQLSGQFLIFFGRP